MPVHEYSVTEMRGEVRAARTERQELDGKD
jgi:hypothetical protein